MEKKNGLWEAIGRVRHIQWIGVLLLGGVLIMIFANAFTPRTESPSVPETPPPAVPGAGTLEQRLESVLSLVAGAGRVRVLVNTRQVAQASLGGEAREEITGVIVVAEGGEKLSVRLELARAVQSLLDVPQSNIEILTMEREIIQ